jgi:hypothetical protein
MTISGWAGTPSTTLVEFPNPFCYLENLYFLPHESTFVVVGDPTIPSKVIRRSDQRGYFFRTQSDPFHNTTKIPGTTLFLFEMSRTMCCSYHFFHILEHIVGAWSFYGDAHFQDVNMIVLASSGEKEWIIGGQVLPVKWEGPNEINKHLLKALFPNARVLTWVQFLEEFQEDVVGFERVITSDRGIAETLPESWKIRRMLGYSRQFFSQDALKNMSDRVHMYAETEIINNAATLRVTYLKRPPPRTLSPAVEEKLLSSIKKMDGVSLRVEDFSTIPFKEQINIIGNTDVLISVHGNGLSHVLFLPPSAQVIEIFPPNTHTVDYRIYAEARGLDYTCIISNRGIIPKKLSYEIGMFGNFSGTIKKLNIRPILEKIAQNKKR